MIHISQNIFIMSIHYLTFEEDQVGSLTLWVPIRITYTIEFNILTILNILRNTYMSMLRARLKLNSGSGKAIYLYDVLYLNC